MLSYQPIHGSVRVVPAPSRLTAVFAFVKTGNVSKDNTTLRREFEVGVAEAVLQRDAK